MSDETPKTPEAVPEKGPIRSWFVAFYVIAALLGSHAGLWCLFIWGRSYDPAWQWAAAAAGALLAVLVVSALSDAQPAFLPRLLARLKAETAGGWPWQQGRGWWIPFFLSLPIASLVHVYFTARYFEEMRWTENSLLLLGKAIGNAAVGWVPYLLIASYGLAFGRRWTRVLGWVLLIISVVALGCMAALAVWNEEVHGFFSDIFPDKSAGLLVTLVCAAWALVDAVLGVYFVREARITPTRPLPPPTAESPWLVDDLWKAILIPFFLALLIFTQHAVLRLEWLVTRLNPGTATSLITILVLLALAPRRGGIKSFLLGREGAAPPRMAAKTAFAFLLFLLPWVFCSNLGGVVSLLPQAEMPSSVTWPSFEAVIFAPVVAEVFTRGLCWEYFKRSFGTSRAVVFVTLASCQFGSPFSIYFPAHLAFELLLSLSLTILRLRTGSLLACCGLRMAVTYLTTLS
jgi:hypothetical protein